MGLNLNKKKIQVSVIGAGYMAEEHIKAFKKFKRFKILGIISKNNLNAKKLASKYKIDYVCKSIDELYFKTFAKLLVIAVPETEVKKVMFKSLNYPWKILSEKPLGLNFTESKQIFLQSKKLKKDKNIVVGFNRRNYNTTKYILSDIHKSKKRLVQIFDQQNIYDYRVVGLPNKIKKNWMFANSTHLIDFANIFCRGNIIKIDKKLSNLEKNSHIIFFSAKYDSGDILIYNALWNVPGPWSITVSNQDKSYKLEPLEALKIKEKNSRKYKLVKLKNIDEKFKIKFGLYNQTKELLRFCDNKKNYLCSVKDSHKTMNLTKKIYS